jgi:ABC-type multidrug transport system fused ATPase/permease subunit
MKKRMVEYSKYAESIINKDLDHEEREIIRQEMLIQISFFQHERLIHLMVTLSFAILSMITLICVLISDNPFLSVLLLLLLLMLFPYVNHYFRLEWGVQKLYTYYDMLEDRPWKGYK